jgi:hypothetical protein
MTQVKNSNSTLRKEVPMHKSNKYFIFPIIFLTLKNQLNLLA